MKSVYKDLISKNKQTPQNEKALEEQILNDAGGYVFEIDKFSRLERFLILGTDTGTYYVEPKIFTSGALVNILKCLSEDYVRTINLISSISFSGRAPKNSPALFALAIATANDNDDCRSMALKHLKIVARTASHLFEFISYMNELRGWGRAVRNTISDWYLTKDLDKLAFQMLKYQNRNGWSHRDVLLKAHVKPNSKEVNNLFSFICDKNYKQKFLPQIAIGFDKAKSIETVWEMCSHISQYNLPEQMIPTEFRSNVEIMKALIPSLGYTAILRNLTRYTLNNVFDDEEMLYFVTTKLTDATTIEKSRVHPAQIFQAFQAYNSGISRNGVCYNPIPSILEALERAVVIAYGNEKPTREKRLIGIDVSGSMTMCMVKDAQYNAAEAAIMMYAVATRNEQPKPKVVFFDTKLVDFVIPGDIKLGQISSIAQRMRYGGTDCAVPINYALEHNDEHYDSIEIYTDSESWFGRTHVYQAMERYRNRVNNLCKLIIIQTTATESSLTGNRHPLDLEVIGFDTNVPKIVNDFISQ